MANPQFKVVEESDKWFIRDEDNNSYGSYDDKKAAQQALEDWKAYYEAPLVF